MKPFTLQTIIGERIKKVQTKNNRRSLHVDKQPDKNTEPIFSSQYASIKLIEAAKLSSTFANDLKILALDLIANKCGLLLNKHYVLPHMDLLSLEGSQDISQIVAKGQNIFVVSGIVKLCGQEESSIKELRESGGKQKINPRNQYRFREPVEPLLKNQSNLQILAQYNANTGIGKLFNSRPLYTKDLKLLAQSAILITFDPSVNEQCVNPSGPYFAQKLEILSQFPLFRLFGKKIVNYVNAFKLVNFKYKDVIYRKGDKSQAVYLIIEGTVNFQMSLTEEGEEGSSERTKNIEVCSISSRNFFGEQQLLFKKAQRSQTAKVVSSNCIALELPGQKFQKLLENQDFNQLMLRTIKMKQAQRTRNIQKAKKNIQQNSNNDNNLIVSLNSEELKIFNEKVKPESKRRFSTFRSSKQKVKVMHGNIIHEEPTTSKKVSFSMLEVNPDHFAATKDKYRQFFAPKPQSSPPESWNFKKLWRILNLQSVLDENQIQIKDQQGKKYFNSHRRLRNQLLQNKSTRPKTTSSNYRTKLQYIAYLQQFNR